MRVAVPKETGAGERRVALVPDSVGRLTAAGFTVAVERGAGAAPGSRTTSTRPRAPTSSRAATLLAGAERGRAGRSARQRGGGRRARAGDGARSASSPRSPTRPGSSGSPSAASSRSRWSRSRGSRARSRWTRSRRRARWPATRRSSLAADRLPRLFPLLMTAAGTVAPAKVLVLGAGVAGLQAIATARRLGAVVSGFDVRPAVREQVESLGASFLDLGIQGAETERRLRGRADAGGAGARSRPRSRSGSPSSTSSITTALVPGRPAPKLIPATAVEQMRPGSVIVDLAAETGGNCELTEPGAEVERARRHDRRLHRTSPRACPTTRASSTRATSPRCCSTSRPGGELALDFDDEITGGACVTRPRGDGVDERRSSSSS